MVRDKRPKVGDDQGVMMMKTTNNGTIHRHQPMDQRHGHREVDRRDEAVLDQLNNGRNQTTNGIITMIDLVIKN